MYPDLATEVVGVYAKWFVPKNSPPTMSSVPGEGYPRNPKKTQLTSESLRNDIMDLKAFVCESPDIPTDEHAEYTTYDGCTEVPSGSYV